MLNIPYRSTGQGKKYMVYNFWYYAFHFHVYCSIRPLKTKTKEISSTYTTETEVPTSDVKGFFTGKKSGFLTGKKIQIFFNQFWIFNQQKTKFIFLLIVFRPVIWLIEFAQFIMHSRGGSTVLGKFFLNIMLTNDHWNQLMNRLINQNMVKYDFHLFF